MQSQQGVGRGAAPLLLPSGAAPHARSLPGPVSRVFAMRGLEILELAKQLVVFGVTDFRGVFQVVEPQVPLERLHGGEAQHLARWRRPEAS